MKTIKILFADDDLKYSMLLKRFLEAEGYEVTYVTILFSATTILSAVFQSIK